MKKLFYRLGLVFLILILPGPLFPTEAAESSDLAKFQRNISGVWEGHREGIILIDLRKMFA